MNAKFKNKVAIDAFNRATERSLTLIGVQLQSQAVVNLTKKGVRDMGGLVNSIAYHVDDAHTKVTCGSNLDYALYIEKGTKPHRTDYKKTEFAENMRGWFHRHGIIDKGIQYLIMRHIRKHGTSAKPFLRPALSRVGNQVPRLVKLAFQIELNKADQ